MPKKLRDALIVANPLIMGIATILIKVTTEQSWTAAVWWLLANAGVTGLTSMYLHLMTSASESK